MADTTWVLCDHTGVALTEVSNASTKSFTARRNLGRSASLALTHADLETRHILEQLPEGPPQLRYYRDDQLRLSSQLTSIEDGLAEGEDSFTAIFKDPFGVLYGDGSNYGRWWTFLALNITKDQGLIAMDLIYYTNGNQAETYIRVDPDRVERTISRTREYEQGQHIGTMLLQLSEVDGGCDHEYLPLDPTIEIGKIPAFNNPTVGKLAEFNVYAVQGTDKGNDLMWGYGPGTASNVLNVDRKLTPPINNVRLTSSDGLISVVSNAESIARHGFWAYSGAAPNDISVQSTLDLRATAYLSPEWTSTITFTPDPLGHQPFDDYWLGDIGRFEGDDTTFQDSFMPKINGITITEGPDDEEVHELEIEDVS